MLEVATTIFTIFGVFIAYVLKKTDTKIDKTSSDLAAHRLEAALSHSLIRSEAFRDFATKLELRDAEQRMSVANQEVQIKLDKLIDRLIDNPRK